MDLPLQGFKVVEVAMWVAGPSTTAVLGDWGADVIKLEDPRTGDPIRGFVTRTMGDPNARIRPPFELDNRNKRSVAVDLRTADGHAFALKLIERADVFVTSLRLDAIDRMKLDYATLSAKNPRLIYASINGYGHRGPDRNRPAYDYAAAWARSGLMATIAEPGQSPPAQRPAMIDHAVGLGLAGAISAALLARERTGRGREVNISLFSMGLWMNASDLTVGLMTGRSPHSESRTDRVNPLWSSYRCADGRWIYFVMIQSDRHWPDFCRALDQSDLVQRSALQGLGRTRDKTAPHSPPRSIESSPPAAPTSGRRFSIATTSSGRPSAPTPKSSTIRKPPPSARSRPSIIRNIPGCRVVNSPGRIWRRDLRKRIAPPPSSANIPKKSRSKSAFHGTKSPG